MRFAVFVVLITCAWDCEGASAQKRSSSQDGFLFPPMELEDKSSRTLEDSGTPWKDSIVPNGHFLSYSVINPEPNNSRGAGTSSQDGQKDTTSADELVSKSEESIFLLENSQLEDSPKARILVHLIANSLKPPSTVDNLGGRTDTEERNGKVALNPMAIMQPIPRTSSTLDPDHKMGNDPKIIGSTQKGVLHFMKDGTVRIEVLTPKEDEISKEAPDTISSRILPTPRPSLKSISDSEMVLKKAFVLAHLLEKQSGNDDENGKSKVKVMEINQPISRFLFTLNPDENYREESVLGSYPMLKNVKYWFHKDPGRAFGGYTKVKPDELYGQGIGNITPQGRGLSYPTGDGEMKILATSQDLNKMQNLKRLLLSIANETDAAFFHSKAPNSEDDDPDPGFNIPIQTRLILLKDSLMPHQLPPNTDQVTVGGYLHERPSKRESPSQSQLPKKNESIVA